MWSYAMAYRLCGAKPEYLDICAHLFEALKKCTLPDGRIAYNTEEREI